MTRGRGWLVAPLAIGVLVHCSAQHAVPQPPSEHAVANEPTTPESHIESSAPSVEVCATVRADRVCLAGGMAQVGTSTVEAHFEERPPRAARLRPFEIDREEVSAAAYASCVASGHCRVPACDDGTLPVSEGAVRCVAWSDARAYCASMNGRLPSEAEWERAAAGLIPLHRAFPWGDDAGSGDAAALVDETPDGVRGLGGGVAEWVADVGAFYLVPMRRDAGTDVIEAGSSPPPSAAANIANDSVERDVDAGPEFTDAGLFVVDDPRGPREGTWRVVRGGDSRSAATQWTSSRRRFRVPADRRSWIGFRCAYDVVPGFDAGL